MGLATRLDMVLVVLMETALVETALVETALIVLERVLMGQTASVQMGLDTGLFMGRMVLDVSLTMAQTVLVGLIVVLTVPRSALMDLHVGRVRDRATLKMSLITRHHLAALGLGLVLLLLPVLLVQNAARMAPNIYPHGQTIGLVSVHDTPKTVSSILHHHLRIGLGLVRLLLATHEMELSSHRQKVLSHGPDTPMAVLKTCLKIQLKEAPDLGPDLLHVNLKTSLNTHHHMALGHVQNIPRAAPGIDPNIHRLGIGPGLVRPDALKMDLSTRHQEVRNHGQDILLAAQEVNLEPRLESTPVVAPVTAQGTAQGEASRASSSYVESQTDTMALARLARFWTIRPWYLPISSLST